MTAANWIRALRSQLPVLDQCVYLNTGTAGPLPTPTANAMAAAVDWERTGGRGDFSCFGEVIEVRRRARELVAQLLGVSPDEIALAHHTSDGINIVLAGMDWQAGDVLVTTALEHDAGAVPMGVLARRWRVDLRFADIGRGERAIEGLERALAPGAKLVVLSHVAYSSGAVLPVRELVDVAHAAGAAVLVDGAQSCGSMPVDALELGADFYTVSGQKWLCGPEGTGALFVAAERIAQLWPAFTSYFSAKHHDFRGQVELHPTARRYETGMIHRPALAGFVASLEWMLTEVGIERAWQRSLSLATTLRCKLGSLDEVVLVTPENQQSALVSFDLPAFSPARLNALALGWAFDKRLVVRSIDHPPYGLRASLGFFNTEDEIDALVDAVTEALHHGPDAVDPARAWADLPDTRS